MRGGIYSGYLHRAMLSMEMEYFKMLRGMPSHSRLHPTVTTDPSVSKPRLRVPLCPMAGIDAILTLRFRISSCSESCSR